MPWILRRMAGLAGLGVMLLAGTACVAQPPYPPIPPPRAEMRPPPPRERLVWQEGHWHWNGGAYDWIPGHWIERPAPSAVWVPGRWVSQGGAWVWEPAHWR